jgi:hypothetical protein
MRHHAQIPSRARYFRVVIDTAWLYPMSNIVAALATTTHAHTFDGTTVVAADAATLEAICSDIWSNTVTALPPQGYNLGVGSLLQDLGKAITFQLPDGSIFLTWRLAQSLTNQASLPSGGATPQGLIGYIPTFVAAGNVVGAGYDPVRVVRFG